jgi:hypothetical protein
VSLDLAHLDDHTRQYMLAELEADVATGTLYRSQQLTDEGQRDYQRLLRDALLTGTVTSFADELLRWGAVRPLGRWQHSKEALPSDAISAASSLLAEREFHRFYLRGLCLRAIDEGVPTLVIYRAKPAIPGRASADAMIGIRITVGSLLEDLRGVFDSWPPNGLPQCRDPGLSVRLP